MRALWLFAIASVGSTAEPVDFVRDIAPLLEKRCHACHGARTQMSGLRLDNREAALKGSNAGPVLVPGKSAESKLIRMVAGLEEKRIMPPAGPRLTEQEVARLREWIDQGAKWPETASAATTLAARPAHWSFQPIARPKPPRTGNETWVRSPIDQFILARLERENIEPSPEAGRRTLIRRVTFDLTGLPPRPADVATFLRDNRPDAYERLVDRLLDSPHYGERWARHWLDLARYADSDGYEKDYVRPHAWRWRHWVIAAFNEDKPFNQFTVEQIAGDLLPNATVEQKAATGFHRNTLTNREGGVNIEQFRVEQVVDRAATAATVWLGLSAGCAQCHDHKYDPITQKEFYQLYAFFNNADEYDIEAPLTGEMGPYLRTLSEYRRKRQDLLNKYRVPALQAPWEARMKEARANPGKWTDWDHAYDALQKYLDLSDRMIDVPIERRSRQWADAMTDHFVINYHRVIPKDEWKQLKFTELRKQLDQLKQEYPALSHAPVIAEDPSIRRKSNVHLRGDWRRKGIEVLPGVPAFLHTLKPSGPATRLDLAAWLVSPDNPLTARVTVNRFWQEFFGRGLVRTSDDFGAQGEKPAHPELLDWLAGRFIDSGWRVKALHKLIVTSATYRQSSTARPEIDARDAGNTLLSRQTRLRLPAESVRDAALSVSDLLYPAVGGKSVRPAIPKGVMEVSYGSSVKWPESAGRDRYRRGLYILFQRTVPYPMLVNFDAPDANTAACRRERSNTPLQALNLLNDPVFVEAAQALAARVLADRSSRVDRLFEIALARTPSPREREWVEAYLRKQIQLLEQNPKQAEELFPLDLPGYARVETAAWAALSSAILNLDEFITRE